MATFTKDQASNLDQTLRPKEWDEYIGQAKIKENLRILLTAARERGHAAEHILLYGPPGLGKTTLANLIARTLGTNMRTTSGPAIERVGDLAAILTNLSPGDVLFIDEIHRLSKSIEEVLYPAMESGVLDIIIGKGPSARTVQLELPPFTLVAATTRMSLLSSPLRSRFSGGTFRLEFYSDKEIAYILERSAHLLETELTNGVLSSIATRCRSTPRTANYLLKRCRDLAQLESSAITDDIVNRTSALLEIDLAAGVAFRAVVHPFLRRGILELRPLLFDALAEPRALLGHLPGHVPVLLLHLRREPGEILLLPPVDLVDVGAHLPLRLSEVVAHLLGGVDVLLRPRLSLLLVEVVEGALGGVNVQRKRRQDGEGADGGDQREAGAGGHGFDLLKRHFSKAPAHRALRVSRSNQPRRPPRCRAHSLRGSVPERKTSARLPGQPERASIPEAGQSETSTMFSARAKVPPGRSAPASFMKAAQRGRASLAPVSLSARFSSSPTQTPVSRAGV